jgi:transposase-like protein
MRLRRHLKPTNKSWRVDETYIRVQGRWCYLYRAIDSTGATIDFLLLALRDAVAAERLFRKALSYPSHPQPASSTPIRPHPMARRWLD